MLFSCDALELSIVSKILGAATFPAIFSKPRDNVLVVRTRSLYIAKTAGRTNYTSVDSIIARRDPIYSEMAVRTRFSQIISRTHTHTHMSKVAFNRTLASYLLLLLLCRIFSSSNGVMGACKKQYNSETNT